METLQCSYDLTNCPIGGGVEACFIFRWYTSNGIQKFQPLEPGESSRDPYNRTTFRPDILVHEFEKKTVPCDWSPFGNSDIWVRIK